MANRCLLVALMAGAAACAKGGDQEEPGAAGGEGTAVAPPPAAPMGPDTGTAQADDAVDDAQILSVLEAMNQTEILPSQVAQNQAQNAQLKEYANRMVTEHTTLGDSLRAQAQAAGLAPAQHPLAASTQAMAQSTTQRLQALQGMDFDTAYAGAMRMSHQQALSMLDERLIPAAQNPALKTALQQKVRPAVEMHLQQIQQIQGSMGGGGQQP